MNLRKLSFYFIFVLILTGTCELSSRAFLCFYGYSFLKPSEYIYDGFYKNLKKPAGQEAGGSGKKTRILILGGSVVSPGYSDLHTRLDTILSKRYGETKDFEVVNVAAPAHTSLDNLLKYNLLENERFDLVIYYEGINDTRVNNIPPKNFKDDYSHVKWYSDIYRLLRHPEIDVTVIPYLLDMAFNGLCDRFSGETYLEPIGVEPRFARFGRELRDRSCYQKNLEGIAKIAETRGDKLLLVSYASYFPPDSLTGSQSDNRYYAKCMFATPVTMWGEPENVRAGIAQHNQVIRKVATKYRTEFLDLEKRMPKDPSLFCDVCHISEPGARRFAEEIVQFIIRHEIV
ncbi:GDSL-like Lipase/Acylhydrolase family [Dyadobacter soli]|uniref:GDSL-like Lipase/Acylhydrolase family n=1 Tax=Dyadobacter soli TaxID=659014 RepID=A0A1G7B5Z3_9BACT|nr:SGNH/GDSL hydrolase family protein [Dyadobacter soli]SDE21726.1 GDSL-like Lipase/Acylhydrolase family [Dyadobacter soli]